ncbi:oxalate decarboxylase family bicupin protein [Granulicella aggregans]|uniref:Oxalate decarboxylase family bicupin protein n=1 Tax=Granulicella aggregans TaxID=474949 RepID=A0A7W8E4S6_9BACT|nr:oxalate decarboxylase family bicupin protein [Granulicella aggregans]
MTEIPTEVKTLHSAEKVEGPLSRRRFMGAAALASAGFASATAMAQTRQEKQAGLQQQNNTDPGPENKSLQAENPNSNTPPFTDHGNPGPIWFSFDLVPKRIQAGGWTHQVTQRELPSSKEIAGVNMRLTAGSFRELHWHTADEWAIMLTGKARVSIMQPDGKMAIDDVEAGDLWYFPAGYPHSIQGLGDDGCEFLLVFNEGAFSEDDTFLLSEFLVHTPPEIVKKNTGWDRKTFDQLPPTELYIFEAPLPGPLEDDRRFLGKNLATETKYTIQNGGHDPYPEDGWRRNPGRRFKQLSCGERNCRCHGDDQTGWNPRDALAPDRK